MHSNFTPVLCGMSVDLSSNVCDSDKQVLRTKSTLSVQLDKQSALNTCATSLSSARSPNRNRKQIREDMLTRRVYLYAAMRSCSRCTPACFYFTPVVRDTSCPTEPIVIDGVMVRASVSLFKRSRVQIRCNSGRCDSSGNNFGKVVHTHVPHHQAV